MYDTSFFLGSSNGLCLVEPVQNIVLQDVQALAGNHHRLSLLQKVLGSILPALPSLVLDESMIPCLALCVVDTAILVVLSAGEQNVHSVGWHVLYLQDF